MPPPDQTRSRSTPATAVAATRGNQLMPVLFNSKHEAVAQAMLADRARVGWCAYKAVYPKSSRHAAETAFGRLLKDATFAARMDELNAAAADGAVATARQVLEVLTK